MIGSSEYPDRRLMSFWLVVQMSRVLGVPLLGCKTSLSSSHKYVLALILCRLRRFVFWSVAMYCYISLLWSGIDKIQEIHTQEVESKVTARASNISLAAQGTQQSHGVVSRVHQLIFCSILLAIMVSGLVENVYYTFRAGVKWGELMQVIYQSAGIGAGTHDPYFRTDDRRLCHFMLGFSGLVVGRFVTLICVFKPWVKSDPWQAAIVVVKEFFVMVLCCYTPLCASYMAFLFNDILRYSLTRMESILQVETQMSPLNKEVPSAFLRRVRVRQITSARAPLLDRKPSKEEDKGRALSHMELALLTIHELWTRTNHLLGCMLLLHYSVGVCALISCSYMILVSLFSHSLSTRSIWGPEAEAELHQQDPSTDFMRINARVSVVHFVFGFIFLAMPCVLSSQIQRKWEEIFRLIRIEGVTQIEPQQYERLLLLENETMHLDANGYFELSKSLLLSVVGLIITYSVILMQSDLPTNTM